MNKVICPNQDLGKLSTNEEFQFWIDKCSRLIVSEVDGFLSAGVYRECKYALSKNIPVFLIRKISGAFELVPVETVERLSGRDLQRAGVLTVKSY